MNKFGGNKRAGAKKQRARISSNASIGSGSSYGSASSARSTATSLADAAALARVRDAGARMGITRLPAPCHLNCQCDDCKKPNSSFLDGLLSIAPTTGADSSEEDPLGMLISGMEDFNFEE